MPVAFEPMLKTTNSSEVLLEHSSTPSTVLVGLTGTSVSQQVGKVISKNSACRECFDLLFLAICKNWLFALLLIMLH